MMQPGVQNDFAGYRRVVGKVEIGSVPGQTVDEAASGTISMCVFARLGRRRRRRRRKGFYFNARSTSPQEKVMYEQENAWAS